MSSADAVRVKEALLTRNFFPAMNGHGDEFPTTLVSSELLKAYEPLRQLGSREAGEGGERNTYSVVRATSTRMNLHSRLLEIPHPVAYAKTVHALVDNWDHFAAVTRNKNSKLRPRLDIPDGRIASMKSDPTEASLEPLVTSEYLVKVDISSFYSSLYTHAIPWAVMGHAAAKAERNAGPANKLDRVLRNMRRGETTGVSVGPGTSLIAAELVLKSVDEELRKAFSFERFIDDFSCFVNSESDAKEFIRSVDEQLRKFNLSLNPRKTEILRLPLPTAPAWRRSLAESWQMEPNRLIDLAIDHARDEDGGAVLTFASRLILVRWESLDEDTQRRLVGRLIRMSGVYPPVVAILCQMLTRTPQLILEYSEDLELSLCLQARGYRTDAMAWLLATLWTGRVTLSDETCRSVIDSRDVVAMSHLVEMHQDRLVSELSMGSVREFAMQYGDGTASFERDEIWLLRYQLFQRTGENRFEDHGFQAMAASDVNFVEKPVGQEDISDDEEVDADDDPAEDFRESLRIAEEENLVRLLRTDMY
jgi:hypothetical protein